MEGRKNMKNRLKLILTGAVLSFAITSFCMAEADEFTFIQNDNIVSVSAKVEPETETFLMVVKKGADINDNANIYAVCQSKSDSDGQVTLTFEMPEIMDSNEVYSMCDLYLKPAGGEEQTYEFPFAPKEKKDAALSFIKSKLDNGGVDQETFSENNEFFVAFKAMGMRLDLISNKNLQDFINYFNKIKSNEINQNNISLLFNKSLMMSKIINSEDVSECLLSTDLSFEGKKYKELSDETLKKWICDYYTHSDEISSFDALNESYIEANILYLISNARFDKIEELLNKYADDLEISSNSDYVTYKNLSKKSTANDKMVSYFKSNPCITKTILLAGIKSAVRNQSGSGGGNGNGGGGNVISGGGKSPSTPSTTITPVKQPEKIGLKDSSIVSWASEAINNLYKKGIISGDTAGYFYPNNNIKREEFVRIIVDAVGVYDKNAECEFEDVSKDKWFYRYVASAYNAGIINGVSETVFGSGMELTRQDMVMIIYRAYQEKFSNIEITKSPVDGESISDYAKEGVMRFYSAGVVNGYEDGRFNPFGNSTKAQCAVIINNILSK